MHRLLVALLPGLIAPALAQFSEPPPVTYPVLPTEAVTIDGLVPRGWTVERRLTADFDRDGRADVLLLLRANDPRNVLPASGREPLDTNPRLLAAALRWPAGGYRLAFQSRIVPRHETVTVQDPFESLEVTATGFRLRLVSFANVGSWITSSRSFVFRYQDGCFRLIGFDSSETHRASMEWTDLSVNYLTRQVKQTTGRGEATPRPQWRPLRVTRPVCAQDVTDGLAFDALLGR